MVDLGVVFGLDVFGVGGGCSNRFGVCGEFVVCLFMLGFGVFLRVFIVVFFGR